MSSATARCWCWATRWAARSPPRWRCTYPVLVEKLVLLNPALSGRLSTRVNLTMKPHVMAERFRFAEWLLYQAAKTRLDYTDYLLKPTNFAERAQISAQDYARIREDARRRGQGRVRAACFMAMQKGDLRGRLGRCRAADAGALGRRG